MQSTVSIRISRSAQHLLIVPFLVWTTFGCSGTKAALEAGLADRAIVVDGEVDDWAGILAPLDKHDITLGVLHDERNLYLTLVTNDPGVAGQISGLGLTVWFDADGGKEQTFGVRFPLGMIEPGSGHDPRERHQDPERRRERFEASLDGLEIIDEAGVAQRFASDGVPGIDVAASMAYGGLVYEIKVPLHTSDERPYGIGAIPGDVVGLGLETPEIDRQAMRAQFSGRRSGGRMPVTGDGTMGGRGRSGGMRGGGRGRPGGGMSADLEPLNVWIAVTLASP